MARKFTPKVVTANHLLDGDVIYLTKDSEWSRNHATAHLLTDEDDANQWLAKATAQEGFLVGAYLADAVLDDAGKPSPVHFREEFRSRGPSNYPDHGKQAEL